MTQNSKTQKATKKRSSDPRVQRARLTYYVPTSGQLARQNPIGKAAILRWYERESRLLEARRKGAVNVEFEAFSEDVDAETKKPISPKKGPSKYTLEKWRLSEQDYLVYKRGLEARFSELKQAHNRTVQEKKKAAEGNV